MSLQIGAYILAGGKSSRMGTNKGLCNIGNSAMINYAICTLEKIAIPITIISSDLAYLKFKKTIISDNIAPVGPLGGLLTMIQHSKFNWNIIVSCDMPFINAELLQHLISEVDDVYSAIVPQHNNQLEPLCALYNSNCLNMIESLILNKKLSMHNLLEHISFKTIPVENETYYTPQLFNNINSPEDLTQANTYLNKGK